MNVKVTIRDGITHVDALGRTIEYGPYEFDSLEEWRSAPELVTTYGTCRYNLAEGETAPRRRETRAPVLYGTLGH